jgi:hypothetical protein
MQVKDITTRFERLVSDRTAWDGVWREIIDVCFPTGPRMDFLDGLRGQTTINQPLTEPRAAHRSRRMYDSTGAIALDRVTAGIESLITPQGQYWHELMTYGPTPVQQEVDQPSLQTEQWLDNLVKYLFRVRYDPRSGWLLSHQRALASTIALGTGVYFSSEAFGTRDKTEAQIPYRFQPIPLNEAYLACNDWGEHDTCFRSFILTTVQAMERFGDKNSEYVKRCATDPAKQDDQHRFIHAVIPGDQAKGVTNMPWASIYVDLDQNHIISQSGYFEFPYIVYTWTLPQHAAYGESPAMVALPEMKTLQVMSRDALLASQLGVRPPVASAYELDRPVNLNPGAINPKMIDPNTGRVLVQPIMAPGDPRFFEATMELRRQHIRQAFFTDLFAILTDKPNMSATEAMIRNQEKGEMLGPAASRIQIGLQRLIDRELGILERKGAFRADSFLAPPDEVREQELEVKFNSPIDRARQMPEVTGMQQAMEFSAGMAQFAPDVLDNFDTDAMFNRARYLLGAPPVAQRDPALVKSLREEKAAAASAQQAAMAVQQGVETAGGLTPAVEGAQAMGDLMRNAGINPAQVGLPAAG